MSTKDGRPAFPVLEGDTQWLGMSLRDYFAAKAMQGMLSDSKLQGKMEEFAARSYAMADAMIKAREEA